jgi:hypothetical protein
MRFLINYNADGKLVAVVPDDFQTNERIIWRENVSKLERKKERIEFQRRRGGATKKILLFSFSNFFTHLLFFLFNLQDFPYAFDQGIEHHVLWSSIPLDHDRIQLEASLRRNFEEGWELIYFVNPTVLKSVPAVS